MLEGLEVCKGCPGESPSEAKLSKLFSLEKSVPNKKDVEKFGNRHILHSYTNLESSL